MRLDHLLSKGAFPYSPSFGMSESQLSKDPQTPAHAALKERPYGDIRRSELFDNTIVSVGIFT